MSDIEPSTAQPRSAALFRKGRAMMVAFWLLLSIAGALNQTVAERMFGRRFDLLLPHLSAGYVMFIEIPRTIEMHSYVDEGGARRPVADLVETRAPLYHRARTEANLALEPRLLNQICRRHAQEHREPTTFLVDEYKLNYHPDRPYRSTTLRCDASGLRPTAQTGAR